MPSHNLLSLEEIARADIPALARYPNWGSKMKNARGIAATKSIGIVVAATAASLLAATGPAYAATGFDAVPMKKHHHHHDGGNTNAVQVPIQACGNNVGNNIGAGVLGHGKAKGGNNKSSCKQKTSAH